jgi:hypothetical protein
MTDLSDERLNELLGDDLRDHEISLRARSDLARAINELLALRSRSHREAETGVGALDPVALEAAIATTPFGGYASEAIGNCIRAYLSAFASPQRETEGREITEARYLVWSNEHHAWWRANSAGYARSILEAGVYSRDEALAIARTARDGWDVNRAPDEIAVALADIPAEIRAALQSVQERT